ncbi:MAG: hypothetical protein QNJ15_15000 [Erythrobacter sp.]|nr:hypothetical protein [Erythrobacter sp.]
MTKLPTGEEFALDANTGNAGAPCTNVWGLEINTQPPAPQCFQPLPTCPILPLQTAAPPNIKLVELSVENPTGPQYAINQKASTASVVQWSYPDKVWALAGNEANQPQVLSCQFDMFAQAAIAIQLVVAGGGKDKSGGYEAYINGEQIAVQQIDGYKQSQLDDLYIKPELIKIGQNTLDIYGSFDGGVFVETLNLSTDTRPVRISYYWDPFFSKSFEDFPNPSQVSAPFVAGNDNGSEAQQKFAMAIGLSRDATLAEINSNLSAIFHHSFPTNTYDFEIETVRTGTIKVDVPDIDCNIRLWQVVLIVEALTVEGFCRFTHPIDPTTGAFVNQTYFC